MCVLRVSGESFDPSAFLARSRLEACAVHSKGQPRFPASRPEGRKWTTSGFNADVSHREWSDLAGQVQDALGFLTRHRDELARLRAYPGVDGVVLDFPIALRIGTANVVVQSDRLPPALLLATGSLGIAITMTIWSAPGGPDDDGKHKPE